MNVDINADHELTGKVIGCAYSVQNVLGCGFLEKVYENALSHELKKQGVYSRQQVPISVCYDGIEVGDYFADLLIEDRLIVELKAVKYLLPEHSAQTINYLKATGKSLALILNFGTSKVEVKRIAL